MPSNSIVRYIVTHPVTGVELEVSRLVITIIMDKPIAWRREWVAGRSW